MQPDPDLRNDDQEELKLRLARTIIEKPWLLEQITRRLESDEIVDADGNPVSDAPRPPS